MSIQFQETNMFYWKPGTKILKVNNINKNISAFAIYSKILASHSKGVP